MITVIKAGLLLKSVTITLGCQTKDLTIHSIEEQL